MLIINEKTLAELKRSAVKQAELAKHVGKSFSTIQRWIYYRDVNSLSKKIVMDKIEDLTGGKILDYAEAER